MATKDIMDIWDEQIPKPIQDALSDLALTHIRNFLNRLLVVEPYQPPSPKQDELWEEVFNTLLSKGDVYSYDYKSAITQLQKDGYSITKNR